MKILYLCCDSGIPVLGYKGASVHVRELVAALGRAGHQVVVAAQVLNKNPWELPAPLNAKIVQVRLGSSAVSTVAAIKEFQEIIGIESSLGSEVRRILFNKEVIASDLKRQCDQSPPDFIYERVSLYGIAGVQLAKLWRVPLLVELNAPLSMEHNTYRAGSLHELGLAAERWALSQADAVLAVSVELKKHLISQGLPPQRIHVLPNGVDPGLFCPAPAEKGGRARLGLSPGPVLGFVGGLRPWHGVDVLPELMRKLAPKHPDVQMLIVGDGPLRAQLERDFADLGFAERVRFTGSIPHDEVPAYIRQMDIALAPYPRLQHSFYFSPLKVFEYMACGVPVIASACGQISEVIKDGKTGLLYSPGKVDRLAAACNRLLGNAALRARLGEAASKVVHTHYTWDHNASRVVRLAESLNKRSSASASPKRKRS